MPHRFLTPGNVLAVVMAVGWVVPGPVAGQTSTAAVAAWRPPQTPWGDPDLQGIYNNATSTPLQRSTEFGDKQVLSDEEWKAWQARLLQTINTDNTPRDRVGNYNDHWFDSQRKELTGDNRTSLIVDPPNGRLPPLVAVTPEREQRRAALAAAASRYAEGVPHSHEDMAMDERCIVRTDRAPHFILGYNNNFQIFQSPGYVVIQVEMIHSARVIPVDGRPHLGEHLRQWLGDSRGHWEGRTLVVETIGFPSNDGVTYYLGNPHGGLFNDAYSNPTFRLIERFTPVDANTLHYEFTVADPQTWTRPWTAMIPWNKTDGQIYEYACHEGNYDMVHMLAGGRALEKAAQGAAK